MERGGGEDYHYSVDRLREPRGFTSLGDLDMKKYMIRRILNLLPTLFIVSMVVFAMIRILPGDPIYTLAAVDESDGGEIDPELYARLLKEYDLDKPIIVQYGLWMWGVIRGDWGSSLFSRQAVLPQIVPRVGFTLQLAFLSWIFGILMGVSLGIVSALKRNKPPDVAATTLAMTGVALPNFWLGLMLIVVFGVWLGWLPIYGYVSILDSPSEWALRMVMPVVTLGTALSATLMRQTRSAMLEVLEEDYIRTARSKGLNERSVIGLHALKNALLPVVTVSSLQLGQLIGGTLITESVFALPGVGKFILDAIIEQDYQVFQMGMLVIVLGVVLANFMADILYAYLDPRIRYE